MEHITWNMEHSKLGKSIQWIVILVICFAVIFGIGVVLKEVIAETATRSVTVSNDPPSVGTVSLNGGSDTTLTENATATVQATTTVTDTDAYSDISSVIGKLYRSGVGSDCSPDDDNNCYSDATCATSSCDGNSCTATCEYEVWFHADPTDAGTWESEYWDAWIKAVDTDNASSSATSTGVDMNTLRALDVNPEAWLGISSAEYDSHCGDDALDTKLVDALDGTGGWMHSVSEEHWFILDLGQTYTIKKVRGRSNYSWDPIDVDVYVSDSTSSWETAVATAQDYSDTDAWVETDTTDKDGRYIKVIILETELGEAGPITWTGVPGIWLTIFDVYGNVPLDYGSLNPGEDTGTLNQTTTITDTGNEAIDAYLYGTNMEKGSDSIAVGYQEYSLSSGISYGSGTDATSSTSTVVDLDLSKPTSHPSTSTDDIYWGLGVPSPLASGYYTGTTTFEAKVENWWYNPSGSWTKEADTIVRDISNLSDSDAITSKDIYCDDDNCVLWTDGAATPTSFNINTDPDVYGNILWSKTDESERETWADSGFSISGGDIGGTHDATLECGDENEAIGAKNWLARNYTSAAGTFNAQDACKAKGSGWRLPTLLELDGIRDQAKGSSPYSRLPNILAYLYWSSSEYASWNACSLYFSNGQVDFYNKAFSKYVRCVRGQ